METDVKPNRMNFSFAILWSDTAILIYLALVKLLIHLLTSNNYGYFGDELYYLDATRHLDFGYVDIPPLVPLLMSFSQRLIGNSLFALHILPATVGAIMVLFSGLMARQLGGGRFAQWFTALMVIVVPFWLAFNSWFAYDAFDQLLVILFLYMVVLITKQETSRRWMVLGIIAGIGIMTKLSMMFLCFGLLVALLVTARRKSFMTIGPWLAGLMATAICTPYLIWQLAHEWPVLTYWHNYALFRPHPELGQFLPEQVLNLNPFTFPVWIMGLYYLLFHPEGKKHRISGLIYITLLILFAGIMKFESRQLVSAYFPLLAAGAVWLEKLVSVPAPQINLQWFKPIYIGFLVFCGILLAPYAMPLLPAPVLEKYLNNGVSSAAAINADLKIPFVLAYRCGWPEMTKEIADIYYGLPEADRQKCTIYAYNYSEAGALNFFGKAYGLPKAISNHLSYHVWGPGDNTGEVMIAFGKGTPYKIFTPLDIKLSAIYNEITPVRFIPGSKYSTSFEKNLTVYICRKPKVSLQNAWPSLQNYY